MLLELRRDTAANWASRNPVLGPGEPGLDSTNNLLKIGDGVTAWSSLTGFGYSVGGFGTYQAPAYGANASAGTPALRMRTEPGLTGRTYGQILIGPGAPVANETLFTVPAALIPAELASNSIRSAGAGSAQGFWTLDTAGHFSVNIGSMVAGSTIPLDGINWSLT